jgi:hypothetical protein
MNKIQETINITKELIQLTYKQIDIEERRLDLFQDKQASIDELAADGILKDGEYLEMSNTFLKCRNLAERALKILRSELKGHILKHKSATREKLHNSIRIEMQSAVDGINAYVAALKACEPWALERERKQEEEAALSRAKQREEDLKAIAEESSDDEEELEEELEEEEEGHAEQESDSVENSDSDSD